MKTTLLLFSILSSLLLCAVAGEPDKDFSGMAQGAHKLADISTDTDETSHTWIALRHHVAEMNDAYLTNWADALDSPPPTGREWVRRGQRVGSPLTF